MKTPADPIYETLIDLHQAIADAFCDLVTETLASNSVFRVSLSGGSTPKRLYEILSTRDLPRDRIHWYWGDERNVPHDHDDRNAKMVGKALLDPAQIPAANVHPVPVNLDDPQAAARQYEKDLREEFAGAEFPEWDLVLLGMGDDAHTASLFPGTNAIDEKQRWFVENWVEKFSAYRYTMTAPAINTGKQIWFLVAGSNKKLALSQVWGDELEPSKYPSQLIRPTRWFVTRDAIDG